MLAAILIANEAGVSADDIRTALKTASLTDMRMQPIIAENGHSSLMTHTMRLRHQCVQHLDFISETELRRKVGG